MPPEPVGKYCLSYMNESKKKTKSSSNIKTKTTKRSTKEMKLKQDRRNYRHHDERNKAIIGKSLDECGAGRSILADSTGEVIAGNGVLEQAEKRGIKIKTVETNGDELVVVVRKDLKPGDNKRKLLALADNAASDTSSWNAELVRQDWAKEQVAAWGVPEAVWDSNPTEFVRPATAVNNDVMANPENLDSFDDSGLPPELQGNTSLEPSELDRIDGDFCTERGRVIITFDRENEAEICKLLNIPRLDKVVYSIEELTGRK